ncbi:DUF58 domain-containing protein [Streptomyces spiramenti]|uniref:DUF58 domain-containing protein n=1 Tax=Streptomyces spiramenti TaxID=2720606 RepID=A0ABX1ARM1_9ACTN|nr:DUF58 domain-containing protein [Streptomyces spiramenti]NJP67710.1 DUF58 domain-containing protein [Streptomyces spiramenti]
MPEAGDPDRGPLRAAFGGLTTRGRSFLAAGAAAGVCAYLLGQEDLLRIGALLALLPLLCVVVLHRTRSRVTAARQLTPARVAAGSESRVRLRLENTARGVPTGLLMLQDRVPYVLGPRPRFVVDRIESGGRREVSYRVRSDLRGRYPLGPLQLRLTDPFGLVELNRSFTAYDVMTVLPKVEALPATALGGDAAGFGEGGRRTPSVTGEDDVIPRDYRHGDDVRRVHWRSTARRGALMVRREEQPRQDRCTVLLDTRRRGYEQDGTDPAFERAVSGAASAVAHLVARGYAVRLVTDTGAVLPGEDGEQPDPAEIGALVMDGLASVEHSDGNGFGGAREALLRRDPGLLVAFLGTVAKEPAAELSALRRGGAPAVAFVAAGQLDHRLEERRMERLEEGGWTVLAHHRDASLAELWRAASRTTLGR